jgi:hypothetical protein
VTADSHLRRIARIAGGTAMRLPACASRRGQAMVEFALIATRSTSRSFGCPLTVTNATPKIILPANWTIPRWLISSTNLTSTESAMTE